MIPYGRQCISERDIDAVLDVLKSDFLTQGPAVINFEESLRGKVQSRFALAVTNATSALHLACLALGLGPGDTLWTSPISFVASANAALYCGANVDFVDIDLASHNMCPLALVEKLESAAKAGQLPKVVMPVHMGGLSCDMEAIKKACDKYGVKIIEDASHAIGGIYNDRPVGACLYSDITVFSFHPVKIITTGEGGALLTNDPVLYEKMALLRSHGVTRDPGLMVGESHGDWYYQQLALGYNYRMTDIQAALGRSQLEDLDEFVRARHQIASKYDEGLRHLPITLPVVKTSASTSSLHLYVIRLNRHVLRKNRKNVFSELRESGIGVNVHYIPIHLQPYFADLGFTLGDFPKSEEYYESAISIPMHPGLADDDQQAVISALGEVLV